MPFNKHFLEPIVKTARTRLIYSQSIYSDDSDIDSNDMLLFDSSSSDSVIPNINLGTRLKDPMKDIDVLDLSEDSISKDSMSEDCKELTLTKDIKSFLLTVTEMTQCTMLLQEMQYPSLAPNKHMYERDAIS